MNNHDRINTGARIKVFGIGGGGTNAVSTMIRSNIEGVDFISANTDTQSLQFSLAPNKIQIGRELTKGLGAGANPDVGRDAALEDRHEIQEALQGSDMVFVTAGMGGGTGTGGASIVAQIAKEMGALTVGVVTKPFLFEGRRRMKHAEIGIEKLREYVDTLIVIPNQQLLKVATPDLSMLDAFNLADNVLVNAVRGISDIINVPGTVNVDFADVKTVMSSTGRALMGVGTATGEGRASLAATQAISSPILEDIDIEGATGILINITAGASISLMEVNEACSIIEEAAHDDADIIFGAVIDEDAGETLRVTVIATGFPAEQPLQVKQQSPSVRPLQNFSTNITIPKAPSDEHFIADKNQNSSGDSCSITSEPSQIEHSMHSEKILPYSNPEAESVNLTDSLDLAFLTLDDVTQAATIPSELALDEAPTTNTVNLTNHIIKDHSSIDQKIDEVLSHVSNIETTNDLDIPTFLRQKTTQSLSSDQT